jgi:hypothetical protein
MQKSPNGRQGSCWLLRASLLMAERETGLLAIESVPQQLQGIPLGHTSVQPGSGDSPQPLGGWFQPLSVSKKKARFFGEMGFFC